LEKLFYGAQAKHSGTGFAEAIPAHGYSQMEVASFLGLHCLTISRIVAANGAQILKRNHPEPLTRLSAIHAKRGAIAIDGF
jgi:hypothetical protein